jgi:hypothetical protein
MHSFEKISSTCQDKSHAISRNAVGAWVMSQLLILRGEQSGLLMRIATTGRRYVVHADEKLTAFVELESAIRVSGQPLHKN